MSCRETEPNGELALEAIKTAGEPTTEEAAVLPEVDAATSVGKTPLFNPPNCWWMVFRSQSLETDLPQE